ncbi:hypothetical protein LY78DRAFT_688095 [Colletotrichum sublineola]|uniref:Uncharacterized protein n=1 Tax=Colletotrichum sublineola TaxID=1173701 RepID=A0A066X5G4_COLSU|nr:hypothetical protein LY78DRAFT_688095 [Colletotrichum sublineola]KDN61230.1 hypothetical protein CSUB01_06081 [Colletotrichum sublineola]
MKAALILTTLLAAAIASPVVVPNVEATEAQKRDLAPRGFPTIAIILVVPNTDNLGNLGLYPVPIGTPTQSTYVEFLTMLFRSFLSAVYTLDRGMGGQMGLPMFNSVPDFPQVVIPSGGITADQVKPLVDVIKMQVQNATNLAQTIPSGLNPTELTQIGAIFTAIQQILNAIIQKLPTTTSPGGVLGSAAPLDGLSGLNNVVTGVLSNINNLLTKVIGGLVGSLLGSVLGSLLSGSGLPNVMKTLPASSTL